MRRILWTGGFDSTWLLIDALLSGDRVEAVTYRSAWIGHRGWQKVANEDEARRRILWSLPTSLRERVGFAVIEEPGYRLPRDVFHEPWNRLREHSPFNATRYYLLTRAEDGHIEAPDGQRYVFEEWDMWADQDWVVGAVPALLDTSLPVPVETGYVAGDSLFKPARRFRADALASLGLGFPLRHRTKQDLLADATRRGFAHLLALTWSCEALDYDRRRTEPCGRCTPCKLRIIGSRGLA